MNEFILQCKSCSTILAISQNYVNDPFQKPYDAFHIGANVCKSINTVVSSEVFDKGAEYNDLICNGCHAPVGKVYQKTVDSVANLQKLFLFRKTTTKKFRPQLSLIPGITQIPQENRDESLRMNALPIKSQASSSDDGSKNNADANGKYPKASSKNLEKEIFKLQSVILNLNERLATLEEKASV